MSVSHRKANQPRNGPLYCGDQVALLFGIEDYAEWMVVTEPPKPLPGYMTFWDPGWSILELGRIVMSRGGIICRQFWYEDQPFATEQDWPRYRRLRMEAVPDSFSRTFDEQQKLLAAGEFVPNARVVLTGMILHYLATGIWLYPDHWVRCADVDLDGDRVVVGGSAGEGIRVYSHWKDASRASLGLAAARNC